MPNNSRVFIPVLMLIRVFNPSPEQKEEASNYRFTRSLSNQRKWLKGSRDQNINGSADLGEVDEHQVKAKIRE